MKTRKRNNEQGQTMAEFAIVLPLLIMLLFGIIEFGITFNNYVALTDAARAAARKGAVSRNDAAGPQAACQNAGYAAATDLKQPPLSITCNSSGGWAPGSDVQVTATYPYTIQFLGIPVITGTLTSVMKERVE
jgi:Flp pilus assembly protein TadG